MVTLAIVLLVIGLGLIVAEMFIPGFGVCGITGVIALILSAVFTIIAVPFGIFIVAAEVAIITVAAVLLIKHIRKSQLYGKLILNESLEFEKKEYLNLERYMGHEGVSKTSLRPVGTVEFNGVDVEAFADNEYIPENVRVKVVNVSNQKITVRMHHGNEN